MSKLKQNKGFTLIELLVALAIVGIILLAFFRVIDTTTKMNVKNDRDIKALNIAQSEIENLRSQIKDYEQSDQIKIEDVIDIQIKNEIVDRVEQNNGKSIIYLKIPEQQESKISQDQNIDYDIEYIKSIDDKNFKIYLDISKSKVNNINMTNEMHMYTINIKVKSLNKDFSEDKYFSIKETKIQDVKILSKNKS